MIKSVMIQCMRFLYIYTCDSVAENKGAIVKHQNFVLIIITGSFITDIHIKILKYVAILSFAR